MTISAAVSCICELCVFDCEQFLEWTTLEVVVLSCYLEGLVGVGGDVEAA